MATNLFGGIYQGKKVLVTGHTGFKGSWLALWLSQLGAQVVGFSKDIPTSPSHFELLNLGLETITGDVTDQEQISTVIAAHKPSIVFHLAAQALVRESYRLPVETMATNIMGTVNVLESCRQADSVKAIVNITSDKCYRNNERDQAYSEDDAMGGHDPYSASKGAADIVANSYRQSFFQPKEFGKKHSTLLAVARAGNVIGGGDWAKDRLIPDIMRAAAGNQAVVIRNPKATRPWQHILEPLSGYLMLGWRLLDGRQDISDSWNFGPGESSNLTVEEVAQYSQKYWPKIQYEMKPDEAGFHEAHYLKLDSTKAHTQLHWNNVWDPETTFKKTIEWYKQYYTTQEIWSQNDLQSYVQDARQAGLECTLNTFFCYQPQEHRCASRHRHE